MAEFESVGEIMQRMFTAPEPRREYSDAEIVNELRERCALDESKIAPDVALRFARHLETKIALDYWMPALAKTEWAKTKGRM